MDARIRYSKKVIKEAFFELLQNKSFNKVTVTDICKLADVNRATFYKYYENPDDLFRKIEDEHISSLLEKIEKHKEESNGPIYKALFDDVRENFEFFKLVLVDNFDEKFRKKYLDALHDIEIAEIEKAFPNISRKQCDWIYYFTAEGCIGIFKEWIYGEIDASLDEMLRYAEDFVKKMNDNGKIE